MVVRQGRVRQRGR
ncbi:hypothetical protein CIB84_004365 [Bambusicola thoracicus]|nr:hypothetical protein CIB84_004365 [Bambusicola thoracicus]